MSWSERRSLSILVRLAVVIVAAGLTAGCFQPLYGRNPASPETESVRDKLAEVEIPIIPTRQGSPEARIAVSMRNALQYNLNGNAGANAPTHRLTMTVAATSMTVIVDPVSMDLLSGSQLDYTDELMGSYFTVRNPNATSACGCGTQSSE